MPTAENRVYFTVSGEGELLGTGNGDPGSHESDKAHVRRAFGGRCQLLVRASGKPGILTVRAESPDISGAEVILEVE